MDKLASDRCPPRLRSNLQAFGAAVHRLKTIAEFRHPLQTICLRRRLTISKMERTQLVKSSGDQSPDLVQRRRASSTSSDMSNTITFRRAELARARPLACSFSQKHVRYASRAEEPQATLSPENPDPPDPDFCHASLFKKISKVQIAI